MPESEPVGPIAYQCQLEGCERRYVLGAETAIYLFLDNALYNHLRSKCPNCGRRITVWGVRDEEVQHLIAFNAPPRNSVRMAVVETTPPFVIKQWQKDCLPGFRELTEDDEMLLKLEQEWMNRPDEGGPDA
jgi:hypothetical protein